jgi:hypothetical protein
MRQITSSALHPDSASVCLERVFDRHDLGVYNGEIERALRHIERNSIELLVADTAGLDMDKISRKLCLVRLKDIRVA